MQTFEIFIEDDRYAVLSLEFVTLLDAARARKLAADRLVASAQHLGIEVRHAGKPVC
jgi:putative hemolysin